MKVAVTNRSNQATSLVLEPIGEVYTLDPGQTRIIQYVGDSAPDLSLDIGDGETKIWEEGDGFLVVEDPVDRV